MPGHNFVPAKDAEFDVFFRDYSVYVTKKCGPPDAPEWSHIPWDRVEDLNGAYADWHAAWIKLAGPHVPSLEPEPDRANHGVRIFWGILAEPGDTDKFRITAPPRDGDDLPHSTFTQRRKYRFDFPEEDRGKTVYFCLRYENSKGGKEGEGPWGPIFKAIIP
jgi:hypothetical protein